MNHRQSVSDYFESLKLQVKTEILNESDETILGTDTGELAEYYYSHSALVPILLDDTLAPQMSHTKEVRTIRSEEREEGYRGEGDIPWEFETLHVSIPIQPSPHADVISTLRSSTYSVSWSPRGVTVGREEITFSFVIKGYCINVSDDQIAQGIQSQQSFITGWLASLEKDIEAGNKRLKEAISQVLTERKQKIIQDRERLAALTKRINIELKPKDNQPVQKVKLNTRPFITKIKPRASSPVVYVLDREKVLGVIDVLENQGRQFEKTPKTYKEFGEEQLRDVLLVNLNTVFEGNATGETFSHRGKTDIYLAIDKGNILVSECKIWGGQALLLRTIEQLLSYLTWRHNFGIVIVFVKQRNMTEILKTATDSIKSAPSYKKGFVQVSTSHLSAVHRSPLDDDKETEVHYLFYNLHFQKE